MSNKYLIHPTFFNKDNQLLESCQAQARSQPVSSKLKYIAFISWSVPKIIILYYLKASHTLWEVELMGSLKKNLKLVDNEWKVDWSLHQRTDHVCERES